MKMSFELQVITDLAVVMVIASVVAFIFYKLKQPLIIGYIIAGIIIGPYTPPFNLIKQTEFLSVFAEIGVVLLLFTIGLEFPLRKLRTLGKVVLGVSAIEISLMIMMSWVIGVLLGWGMYDTLFLGAALASSSTTIIAKVLSDQGKIAEMSSTIMLGILVVEDIVVVIVLAMMQNIVIAGSISVTFSLWLVVKLIIFIGGTLVLGGLFIPKAIDRFAKVENKEFLPILLLGLCFIFAIMATQIGFSAALGAFLIGVVVARSYHREKINRQIEPFKIVFGAIFFVSMGALMDITQIVYYWIPAAIIIMVVIGTKLLSCGLGTRMFGYRGVTSLRVGLGMAQIGEFGFIVAKAGQDLGVTSSFLLPIIGVATMVTAFITPYLIQFSFRDPKPKQSNNKSAPLFTLDS
jgi:monovalent cation:H+ antiporter-2, CPA2 family